MQRVTLPWRGESRGLSRTGIVAVAASALAVAGLVAVAGPASSAAPRAGQAAGARFAGVVRPVATKQGLHRFGDPAQGTPPLIWHGGPVMATPASANKLTITPIFWVPASHPMPSTYRSLINRYTNDAAHDSGKTTNIYSTLYQYSGSNGAINYHFVAGTPIVDGHNLPTSGCTVNSGGVYSDGSGYDACLDDDQIIAETENVVAAHSLPVDLGHIYVMFTPKHVESCFYPGNPSNQACTINSSPSAAYCAYHSQTSTGIVYANMPWPIYQSPVGYTCGSEAAFPTNESPNGNVDADVEISPYSHEVSEAITDPDTSTGYFDSSGYENGDECAYTYGTASGTAGALYNQTINGHHYLTQEEFSNLDFAATQGGCLQSEKQGTPIVKSVSPKTGSTAGGTRVTVTGSNFAGTTSVKFGTTAGTGLVISTNKALTITAPAHAAGTVDVRVTTGSGTSAVTTLDHFTYS